MSSSKTYKIIITEYFKKQLKRLLKKDRSLKENLKNALLTFHKEYETAIGMGVYKMRLKREGKGKSGGYRMYVFIMEIEGILTPICIYPKNEKENLSYAELIWHLEKTKEELQKTFG